MPQEATGKTGVPSERRQKPERPRDELGRPLPWEAENRLHLPDFDVLSVDENDRLGRELLSERNYFGAHEAWETAWKQSRGSGEEELFKGLSQMGAGYVHLLRGNAHGRHCRRATGITVGRGTVFALASVMLPLPKADRQASVVGDGCRRRAGAGAHRSGVGARRSRRRGRAAHRRPVYQPACTRPPASGGGAPRRSSVCLTVVPLCVIMIASR